MRQWKEGNKSRSLLLLSDTTEIAERLEAALVSYRLASNITWYRSFKEFHKSLLEEKPVENVDLCLVAYAEDEAQREAVIDIRRLPAWDLVPVVVFLPASSRYMTRQLYQLGANSVLNFPPNFEAMRGLVGVMDRYWFEVVSLP